MSLMAENIAKFIVIAGSPFVVLFVLMCIRRSRARRIGMYKDNVRRKS